MDAGINIAPKLAELQVQLAQWQLQWKDIWTNITRRMNVADQDFALSERVLEMSGLLSEPITLVNQPHQYFCIKNE